MIQVKNLHMAYGQHIVFDAVDITFPENKVSILLGRNGSGKTTLVKALSNVTRYEGTIRYGTKALSEVYEDVFVIYDDFPLYDNLTGYQNLKMLLEDHNLPLTPDALDVLPKRKLKQKVKGYSLGERKKLYMIALMLKRPKFLILDEITNGLDFDTQMLLASLLKDENKNMTVLVTSHNFHFFNDIVTDVYTIKDHTIRKIDHEAGEGVDLIEIYKRDL